MAHSATNEAAPARTLDQNRETRPPTRAPALAVSHHRFSGPSILPSAGAPVPVLSSAANDADPPRPLNGELDDRTSAPVVLRFGAHRPTILPSDGSTLTRPTRTALERTGPAPALNRSASMQRRRVASNTGSAPSDRPPDTGPQTRWVRVPPIAPPRATGAPRHQDVHGTPQTMNRTDTFTVSTLARAPCAAPRTDALSAPNAMIVFRDPQLPPAVAASRMSVPAMPLPLPPPPPPRS